MSRLSVRHLLIPFVAMVFPHAAIAEDAAPIVGGTSFIETFENFDRKRWVIANGWANSPDQGCIWSAGNVRPAAKSMSLELNNRRRDGKEYSCAEVQTREQYGHGTYEVRMRPAAGPGIVSSFFSYVGPAHGVDKSQERWLGFDFVGNDLKKLLLGYSSGGRVHRHKLELAFDPSEAMNDYAIQWTPRSVRWFVNGQLMHTLDLGQAELKSTVPAKVFFSLRNGLGDDQAAWLGRFEYDGRPLFTTYEYIAFTAFGAACQFPTSVVCKQGRPQ